MINVQYGTSKCTRRIWSVSQQTDRDFIASKPAVLLVGTQHYGRRRRINLEEMVRQSSVSKCVWISRSKTKIGRELKP